MHISNAVTFQRVSRSPCQHVELTWNVFSGHGVVHHNQMYVLTLCASAAQVGRSQVILIWCTATPVGRGLFPAVLYVGQYQINVVEDVWRLPVSGCRPGGPLDVFVILYTVTHTVAGCRI